MSMNKMIKTNSKYMLVNDEKSRGHMFRIIRDGDIEKRGSMVLRSFDHPMEVTPSYFKDNIQDFVFSKREEGTVLRCVYDPETGDWLISTHNTPDARKHSWGSRRFGVVFDKVIKPQLTIDITQAPYRDYVFIILLQDPENKMVCQMELGGVHLTTLRRCETSPSGWERVELDIGLRRPTVVTATSVEDLEEQLRECNPYESMGLVAMRNDCQLLETLNLTTDAWNRMARFRGNEPHLVKRYLELDSEDAMGLEGIFPEYCDLLTRDLLQRMLNASEFLQDLYVKRHVHNIHIQVVPFVHKFMRCLLGWVDRQLRAIQYEKTKPLEERRYINRYVNRDVVFDHLKTIPPCELNRILKAIESNTVFVYTEVETATEVSVSA